MENITVNMENLTEEERKQLLALVKKGNKTRSKVWKPEYGEKYYSCCWNGRITSLTWCNNGYDNNRYNVGTCFKTKEEAEFFVEKRKVEVELKRFSEEHNDEEIEWDFNHGKYSIVFNSQASEISTDSAYVVKGNAVYFTSEKIAEQAIKEIGEERLKKYYFEVD